MSSPTNIQQKLTFKVKNVEASFPKILLFSVIFINLGSGNSNAPHFSPGVPGRETCRREGSVSTE